ncbi:hypothetical protein RRG08_047965 [Elysia crispata]|uniref:Uncharacterized protein n=1 Tax=Elysia crispata TaxID=231223 RepID=A0AAE0ZVE5_9GAST|nr:hypothetical protein RRG08_047965 [Elysia crispata]
MVESSLPEIGSRWGPHVGVDSMEEMENERDTRQKTELGCQREKKVCSLNLDPNLFEVCETSNNRNLPPRPRNALRPVAETIASKLRKEVQKRFEKRSDRAASFNPSLSRKQPELAKRSFSRRNSDITVSRVNSPKLSRQISDIPVSNIGATRSNRRNCERQAPHKGLAISRRQNSDLPMVSRRWSYDVQLTQTGPSLVPQKKTNTFMSRNSPPTKIPEQINTKNAQKCGKAKNLKLSRKIINEPKSKFPECKIVNVKLVAPDYVLPDRVFGPPAPVAKRKLRASHLHNAGNTKNTSQCSVTNLSPQNAIVCKNNRLKRHQKCYSKKDRNRENTMEKQAMIPNIVWNKHPKRRVSAVARETPLCKYCDWNKLCKNNMCSNNCGLSRDEALDLVSLYSDDSSDTSSLGSLQLDTQSGEKEEGEYAAEETGQPTRSNTADTDQAGCEGHCLVRAGCGGVCEAKSSDNEDQADTSSEDGHFARGCFSEDDMTVRYRNGNTQKEDEAGENERNSRSGLDGDGCNFSNLQGGSHDASESDSDSDSLSSATSKRPYVETAETVETGKMQDMATRAEDEVTESREHRVRGKDANTAKSASMDSCCCCRRDDQEPRLTVREMVKCLQERIASPEANCKSILGGSVKGGDAERRPPRKIMKEWLPPAAERTAGSTAGCPEDSVTVLSSKQDASADISAIRPRPRPRKLTSDGAAGSDKHETEVADATSQESRMPEIKLEKNECRTDPKVQANFSAAQEEKESVTERWEEAAPQAKLHMRSSETLNQATGFERIQNMKASILHLSPNDKDEIQVATEGRNNYKTESKEKFNSSEIKQNHLTEESFTTITLSSANNNLPRDSEESNPESRSGSQTAVPGHSQWTEALRKAKLALNRIRSRSLSPSQVSAKISQLVERGKLSFNKVIKSWSNMDATVSTAAHVSESAGLTEGFRSPLHFVPDASEPHTGPGTASSRSDLPSSTTTTQGDSFEPIYCLRINSPNLSSRRRHLSEINSHRGFSSVSARGLSSEQAVSGAAVVETDSQVDKGDAGSDEYNVTQPTQQPQQAADRRSPSPARGPQLESLTCPNPPCESSMNSETLLSKPEVSSLKPTLTHPSPLGSKRSRSPVLESILETESVSDGAGYNLVCPDEQLESAGVEEMSQSNVKVQVVGDVSSEKNRAQEIKEQLQKMEDIVIKLSKASEEGAQLLAPNEVPTRASLSDCSRDTRHDLEQISGHEDATGVLSSAPLKTQSLVNACDTALSESGMTDMMALLSQEVNIKRYPSYPDLTDLEDDDKEVSGAAGLLCQRESLTAIQAMAELDMDEELSNSSTDAPAAHQNSGDPSRHEVCGKDATTTSIGCETNRQIHVDESQRLAQEHEYAMEKSRSEEPSDSARDLMKQQSGPRSPPPRPLTGTSLGVAAEHHNSPQIDVVYRPEVKVGTMVSLLESCKVLTDSNNHPAMLHHGSCSCESSRLPSSTLHSLATGHGTESHGVPDDVSRDEGIAELYLPSPPTHSPGDGSRSTENCVSDSFSSNSDGQLRLHRNKEEKGSDLTTAVLSVDREGDQQQSVNLTAVRNDHPTANCLAEENDAFQENQRVENTEFLDGKAPLSNKTRAENNDIRECSDGLDSRVVLDADAATDLDRPFVDHSAQRDGSLIGEALQNIKALTENAYTSREAAQTFIEADSRANDNIRISFPTCTKDKDLEVKESPGFIAKSPVLTDDMLECEEQDSSLTGIQAISASSGLQTPEEKLLLEDATSCFTQACRPGTKSETHKPPFKAGDENSENNVTNFDVQEQKIFSCMMDEVGRLQQAADSDEKTGGDSVKSGQQIVQRASESCQVDYEDQDSSLESDELNESKLNLFLNEDSGCDLSLNSQSRSYKSFSTDEDKSSGAGETLPLPCDVELKRKKKKPSKNLNSGEGPFQQMGKAVKVGISSGSRGGSGSSGSNSRALSTQNSPDLNADGGSKQATGLAPQPPRAAPAQKTGEAASRQRRKEIKWDDELSIGDHEEVSTQSSSEMSSNRCNSCVSKTRALSCGPAKRSNSCCKTDTLFCRSKDKKERTRGQTDSVTSKSYRSQVRRSPPPPGMTSFNPRRVLAKSGEPQPRETSAPPVRVPRSSSTHAASLHAPSPGRASQGDNPGDVETPVEPVGAAATLDRTSVAQWGDVGPVTKFAAQKPPDITVGNLVYHDAGQDRNESIHANQLPSDKQEELNTAEKLAQRSSALPREFKTVKLSRNERGGPQLGDDEAAAIASNFDSEDSPFSAVSPRKDEQTLNNNHTSDVSELAVQRLRLYPELTARAAVSSEQCSSSTPDVNSSASTDSFTKSEVKGKQQQQQQQQKQQRQQQQQQMFFPHFAGSFHPRHVTNHPQPLLCRYLPFTSSSLGDLRTVGESNTGGHDFVSRLAHRVHSTDLAIARACSFVSRSQKHLDRCDQLIERSSTIIRTSQEMLAASRTQMENTFKALNLPQDKSAV